MLPQTRNDCNTDYSYRQVRSPQAYMGTQLSAYTVIMYIHVRTQWHLHSWKSSRNDQFYGPFTDDNHGQ